jgi:hypothetical protein
MSGPALRVDRDVYDWILAAKREVERERADGVPVSMSDGVRRALRNAGVRIEERARVPRRPWPYREPKESRRKRR